MTKLLLRVLLAGGIVVLATVPPSAEPRGTRAAAGVAQRLVGAWVLTTRTVSANGKVLADPVLGEKPIGRLYYDASGVMSLQMMRPGRTTAIGTPTEAKDRANPRAILGYDSYFGKYSVDERASTVTHHVDGSLFPEDVGQDWVRPLTLDGDTLTLKFTSPTDGVTRTLVFHRLR